MSAPSSPRPGEGDPGGAVELTIRVASATAGAAELHGPWPKPVVIARGSAYRIGRIPENELVLDGPTVSRRHATIVWSPEAERPTIEDLASANGTSVDGVAVQAGQPRPLHDGAVIDIGEHRLGVGKPPPARKTPPPTTGRTPPPTTTGTPSAGLSTSASGRTPAPASGRTPPPTPSGTATRTTHRPAAADGVGYVSFSSKGKGAAPEERRGS